MTQDGKVRGYVVWLLVLVIAAVAVFFYLRRDKGPVEEKYRTETAERGDVTMTVTATGTISAVTTVQVGSQVSGIIAHLYADFNSPVKKDQLLAELDPTPFGLIVAQRRADLTQSEVQMNRALLDFKRQERLLQENLAAQADYDAAQAAYQAASAQVDQSRAALSQAETNQNYTKIKSPIDGVVVARQYDVGQTVAASFQAPTLFTIAQDLTKMQVLADVDQSDIGRVKVGQTAKFTVDAYPEQDFRGTIAQIRLNATSNQNVITYPVVLSVPNPDEKLRPQMTANVNVEVDRVKDVLRIPNSALRFRPTQPIGGTASSQTGGQTGGQGGGQRASAGRGAAEGGQAQGGSTAEAGQPRSGGEGGAASGEGQRHNRGQGAGSQGWAGRRGRGEGQTSSDGTQSSAAPSPEQQAAQQAARGGGFGAAAAQFEGALGRGGPASARSQTIYVMDASGTIKKIMIRTGISDGKFTQVVDGDLKAGDKVVVGLATVKAETTGARPPGGGGRFF